MIRPTKSTLQDFCRACLTEVKHKQKYNITTMDPKVQLWLEDCKLKTNATHNIYSEAICKRCYEKFVEILKFQKMCIRSQQTVDNILLADCRQQQKQLEVPDGGNLLKNNLSADEQISVLNDIYGNNQWPDYSHRIRDSSSYQSPRFALKTANTQPTIISNTRNKSTQSFINTENSVRYIKEEAKLKHIGYNSQSIKTTFSKHSAQKTTTVIKNSNSLNKVNFKLIDGTNLDTTFTAKQPSNICQECKTSSTQQATKTKGNETEIRMHAASSNNDDLSNCTKCGNKFENPQQMAKHFNPYKVKPNLPMPNKDNISNYKSKRSLTEQDLSRIHHSRYSCNQSTATANQQSVKKSSATSTRISGQLEMSCSQNVNAVRKSSILALRERRLQNILEKPYHCEECGKRFIQLVALKTHLKTHDNLLIKMKSLSIIV